MSPDETEPWSEDAEGESEPERGDRGLKGGTLHERTPSLGEVQRVVERHAKAYETRRDPGPFGEVHTFHVQREADMAERFARIRDELKDLDPRLMALYRRERGEEVIRVSPRPRTQEERVGLSATLFVATVVTTVLSGSFAWISYHRSEDLTAMFAPDALLAGALYFAAPLMAVLLLHEVAHHVVAGLHKVQISKPYFIPVPPVVFFPSMGTFGSVLSVWDPMPSRKALFDVGVAGPLVAFVAALPVILVGLSLTAGGAMPVPHDEVLELSVVAPNGETWGDGGHDNPAVLRSADTDEGFSRRVAVNLTGRDHGGTAYTIRVAAPQAQAIVNVNLTVLWEGSGPLPHVATANVSRDAPLALAVERPPDATRLVATIEWPRVETGTVRLGEPLAFMLLSRLAGPPGNLVIHPMALAGWVALVVTSINLLPAGQLDGGHVARALLGSNMKWASYLAIAGLMVASFAFVGWIYLVLLIVLFTGIHHPAPLDDHTPLDPTRRLVGLLALLVFALSFVPVPVSGL